MKVAIVGGGIIGLSCALELRTQLVEVVVFDRGEPGAEASIAAGGMLAPQSEAHAPGPFLDLCLRSRTIWPAFAARVAEQSGHPSSYLQSGILLAAFDDNEVHSIDATAAWQKACALRVDVLTGDEARRLEPLLSPRVLSAAWFPDEHQVDPTLFLPALIEACRRSGVQLVHAEVVELVQKSGVAIGVRHAGGLELADQIVLAAGAWSSRIAGTGLPPDLVEPVRGEVLQLQARSAPARILGGPGCYLVPRADGRLVVGATMERVGFDKTVTPGGVEKLLTAVRALAPALAQATLTSCWAGLRPWAPGELPLIGPGPLKNLVLATGHYRNGILLAPLTARLVSQVILDRRTTVELKPFRYDRVTS